MPDGSPMDSGEIGPFPNRLLKHSRSFREQYEAKIALGNAQNHQNKYLTKCDKNREKA